MIYRLTLAAIGLLSAAAAQSADNPLKFELTPYGAYRFGGTFDVVDTDDSYKLVDSPGYGLIFNIRQRPNTQWEILYSAQHTEAEFSDSADGVLDVDTQILQGGGTYQGEGERVRPYLALTVGGTRIKTSSDGAGRSDTFWSASIGIGLQIQPTNRLGLRLEARAYGTLLDSDTDLFCQTGSSQNICAVRLDGTVMSQIETIAGIVFRF